MPGSLNARSVPRQPRFVRRVFVMTLVAGLPALILGLVLLWSGDYGTTLQWTLTAVVVICWMGISLSVRRRVEVPLQTLSNLLASLREGDYSFRARRTQGDDPLAEVMREANSLIGLLSEQRLGALEAAALLRKVMEEIDVAVFAFDADDRLRLVNRSGEKLLARPSSRLLGMAASELGLGVCLAGPPDAESAAGEARRVESTLRISFPGSPGPPSRWGVSRSRFRQDGLPLQLLVLTDLRRALREEELEAWRRLVRVLGHEINNSLAPIKSIAGTMESLLRRKPRPSDWEDDMERSLNVIGGRAEALSRFTAGYASLARLPKPRLQAVAVESWIRRVAAMETRLRVAVTPGPQITIDADSDQLEQLLINLVRNAADAALETGGAVTVGWAKTGSNLEAWVTDEGPGISNPGNLFVPFFTTKPRGAGVGLVLSRQIAEAHGGALSLENRSGARGAEARVTLPIQRPPTGA